ncbi:Down syndrome cell adhesion molecule-like [Argiope bruennichi]|uniref:Down syndrome cell adhesion molecule-like n=1 Tax=Argiope bruennichi TaxID=94029 RepID=A0A8T0G0Z1_ARGBR|nr:Down syndrome cell adhesion molecule-like [Argiope bruennichi]
MPQFLGTKVCDGEERREKERKSRLGWESQKKSFKDRFLDDPFQFPSTNRNEVLLPLSAGGQREKELAIDSSSFEHVLSETSVVCTGELTYPHAVRPPFQDSFWSSDVNNLVLLSTSGFLASFMENNMVAPRFRTIFFDIFLLILQISIGNISSFDLAAPTFTIEPPYQFGNFYNPKFGAEIPNFSAHGRPPSYISWVRRVDAVVEDIPGLRHLRPNGSLVFMPFGPEDYRQDIHASIYKCVASNIVGILGSL